MTNFKTYTSAPLTANMIAAVGRSRATSQPAMSSIGWIHGMDVRTAIVTKVDAKLRKDVLAYIAENDHYKAGNNIYILTVENGSVKGQIQFCL